MVEVVHTKAQVMNANASSHYIEFLPLWFGSADIDIQTNMRDKGA